jgi:outer membrane putative beta-barrel porin/alpha-amylase
LRLRKLLVGLVAWLLAPLAARGQDRLALLIPYSLGPQSGLVIGSDAVLPDGTTHSEHFFGDSSAALATLSSLNAAIGTRLASLPLPSPAAAFTYSFSATSGVFTRSTQSLGPILGDRADTLGKKKLAVGIAYQRFNFDTIDGIGLGNIPFLFRHSDYQLGGGRSDVITSTTSIGLRSEQLTSLFNYGLTDSFDLALAIPFVRVDLGVTHDLTLYRFGTGSNVAVHYFPDPSSANYYGDHTVISNSGNASGIGDLTIRAKARLKRRGTVALALGSEIRLPTGDEMNLLGSGAVGVKPFVAFSFAKGPLGGFVDLAYQWNGESVLAGNPATSEKARLPDEFSFTLGADIHIVGRLSIELGLLGRQLTTERFSVVDEPAVPATAVSPDPPSLVNTHVDRRVLGTLDGAVGLKLNPTDTLLIDLNVLYKVGGGGLRANITPLVGIEFTF